MIKCNKCRWGGKMNCDKRSLTLLTHQIRKFLPELLYPHRSDYFFFRFLFMLSASAFAPCIMKTESPPHARKR